MKQILNNKRLLSLSSMVLTVGVAIFSGAYIYYRFVSGIILGLAIFITVYLLAKSGMKTKGQKVYQTLLGLLGSLIFFGSLMNRVTYMYYPILAVIILGMGYLIFQVVKELRQKKAQLIWPILALLALLASLGARIFGTSMFVSSAAAYDDSVSSYIKGNWLTIERQHHYPVRAIVNRPATTTEDKLPLIINVHGGSWIGGTAAGMDGDMQALADDLKAVVINVDYRLLFDKVIPDQIQEVVDTALYAKENADTLGIDERKIFVFGQSAGGHLAAGAAVALAKQDFSLAGTMLYYPFSDFTVELENADMKLGNDLFLATFMRGVDVANDVLSPASASKEVLQKHSPVFLEIGSNDILQDQGEHLAKKYAEAGVDINVLRLEGATHGFLADDLNDREEVMLQKTLENQAREALIQFYYQQVGEN